MFLCFLKIVSLMPNVTKIYNVEDASEEPMAVETMEESLKLEQTPAEEKQEESMHEKATENAGESCSVVYESMPSAEELEADEAIGSEDT